MRTYTVKVYQAPSHATVMAAVSAGRPPPRPTALPDVRVQGRNIDAARKAAKKRLGRLRSLSCGLNDLLHAVLQHPDDIKANRAAAV